MSIGIHSHKKGWSAPMNPNSYLTHMILDWAKENHHIKSVHSKL